MPKRIVLYTRRNVGLYSLSYLIARGFHVQVITDDDNVKWLANDLCCPLVDLDCMMDFDLFICIHGNKIIDRKYLQPEKFINIHPCLFKYPGHNPIKRYIENEDIYGSVESHWMTEKVDSGEIIHSEGFATSVCKTHAEFYNQALPYYFKVISETIKKV